MSIKITIEQEGLKVCCETDACVLDDVMRNILDLLVAAGYHPGSIDKCVGIVYEERLDDKHSVQEELDVE